MVAPDGTAPLDGPSVSSVASRQHLRSANRGLLVVPRYRLSSYGLRAFSVAGPAIWNWLPDSLRDPAISRDSFRRSLNTFLFPAYCVHSALELSGRCALQIYLHTYLLTSPATSLCQPQRLRDWSSPDELVLRWTPIFYVDELS